MSWPSKESGDMEVYFVNTLSHSIKIEAFSSFPGIIDDRLEWFILENKDLEVLMNPIP